MKDVARLLNDMLSAGVIADYAIFGAVAQMRYTPTVATMDAHILVVMEGKDSLDVLKPIYDFCADRGYAPDRETILIAELAQRYGLQNDWIRFKERFLDEKS